MPWSLDRQCSGSKTKGCWRRAPKAERERQATTQIIYCGLLVSTSISVELSFSLTNNFLDMQMLSQQTSSNITRQIQICLQKIVLSCAWRDWRQSQAGNRGSGSQEAKPFLPLMPSGYRGISPVQGLSATCLSHVNNNNLLVFLLQPI